MNAIDVFPTKFFEHKINDSVSFSVLNEILRKRETIKEISSASQKQSTDVYQTDYWSPVRLESFNDIINLINQEFTKYNVRYIIANYWCAIYSGSGHHSLHNHSERLTDSCNYSGILYLTNIGATTFFSTSPNSFESKFHLNSEIGKIVLFPSKTPHIFEPTFIENNERFVVAFNGTLINE